jgi:AcrR family transcriptional regulator
MVIRGTILREARGALIRRGYSSLSMRKLAEKVGCSPGTIYLYFRSKEHLVNCLVEDAFDKLLNVLDEAHDSEKPVQSLRNKLRAYVNFGLRFPNHYHLAFVMRPTGRAVTTEGRPHPSFDVLRDAVRRCVDQKRFPGPDIETTSQVLWTAIHGVTSLLIVLPKFPWVDQEKLIDSVIDNAIAGLRQPSEKNGRNGERHGPE